MAVDLHGDDGLAVRGTLVFGRDRPSAYSYACGAKPSVAAPESCPSFFGGPRTAAFTSHFKGRRAGGTALVSISDTPDFTVWVRHRDKAAVGRRLRWPACCLTEECSPRHDRCLIRMVPIADWARSFHPLPVRGLRSVGVPGMGTGLEVRVLCGASWLVATASRRQLHAGSSVERRVRFWRREVVWRRSPRRTAAPNESEPLSRPDRPGERAYERDAQNPTEVDTVMGAGAAGHPVFLPGEICMGPRSGRSSSRSFTTAAMAFDQNAVHCHRRSVRIPQGGISNDRRSGFGQFFRPGPSSTPLGSGRETREGPEDHHLDQHDAEGCGGDAGWHESRHSGRNSSRSAFTNAFQYRPR